VLGNLVLRIVHDLIAAKIGSGPVEDIVGVEVVGASCFKTGGKRRKLRDDDTDRRCDDDVRGAPRLVPDAAREPVRDARVVDTRSSLRQVSHDGAAIWVDVIVPVSSIYMSDIRRNPILRLAPLAGLRNSIGGTKARSTQSAYG
jgi:hypothetical protein